MFVLFETPALFKVLDEGKLSKVEDLSKEFSTADSARKVEAFSKFENTPEAVEAATKVIDGATSKGPRRFLKAHCDDEILAVADSKLGNSIKERKRRNIKEKKRGLKLKLSG